MSSPRILSSATRTGVYGTLVALFAIHDPQTLQMLDAALLGCVLADFGTWLIVSLLALPEELWHGAYDAVINTLFGIFFFRTVQPAAVFEGEAIAVGFIACLATLIVKVIYYAGDYLRETEEDGL